MIKLHTGALLILSLLVSCPLSATEKQEVTRNHGFDSPDGKFNVTYLGGSLRFRNNHAGGVYPQVAVSTPLYSLKWMNDSTTVVTVEHLAGGTYAALIHFDGNSWRRHGFEPAGGPYNHIEVIGQKINHDIIRITYAADLRKEGVRFLHYMCSLDINPATNVVSNETRKEVTEEEYEGFFDQS